MNNESLTPNFGATASNATTSDTATSDTTPVALSQVAVVGAVTMTLAGLSFLVTLVLVLSLWMPSWVATLATTLLLTATSLAVFASAHPNSRLRGAPISKGYAAFPIAPVSVEAEPRPAPVLDPAFQGTVIPASPVESFEPVRESEAVQAIEATQEIEAAEFEDALPENDEQETTVVRHVDRLLNPAERAAFGQHVGLGHRTTNPLFQKSTQPSIAR
jgi:hypothetical protein